MLGFLDLQHHLCCIDLLVETWPLWEVQALGVHYHKGLILEPFISHGSVDGTIKVEPANNTRVSLNCDSSSRATERVPVHGNLVGVERPGKPSKNRICNRFIAKLRDYKRCVFGTGLDMSVIVLINRWYHKHTSSFGRTPGSSVRA